MRTFGSYEKGTFKRYSGSSTATATLYSMEVAGARSVSFRFKRSNHSAGSSAFTVEATIDGDNWFAYNKLIDNVTNTNGQNLTRVAGKTLNSDSEAYVHADLAGEAITGMRVKVAETTDGTHEAESLVVY